MSEIIKKAASNEVVQLLYNDLRQRQENIPSAENIVMVQDQQPTVPANKVWLTETPPAGVEVPTYQEFTGVIAPDYADLDFPVSAGEHCIHNGVFYTAIQNINASEAWTAAHWESGSVSSKLIEISNDIANVEDGFDNMKVDEPLVNLYAPQEYSNILDGYILKRGVPQTQYGSGYIVVDYIPVTGGDTINFNVIPWNGADDIYRGAEYDSNKEFIKVISSVPHKLSDNASYIRFSVHKNSFGGDGRTAINSLNDCFVLSNGTREEYTGIDENNNMFLSNSVVSEDKTYFVDASKNEILILSKMFGVKGKDVGIKIKNFTRNTSLQFSSFGTLQNNSPFVSNKPSDYVEFMATGEDFFGPIVGFADSNGDGENPTTGKFTGGMHKYNNYNTARLLSQDIYFDGVKKAGFVGYCDTIDVVVTYNVQVSNTVKADGTGREVVKQITKLHFENGVIYTETQFVALEPMSIQSFYFMQGNHKPNKMGANGIRYIGSDANRGIYDMDSASNSGDKNARTMRMLSDTLQMDITIDDYDVGRFSHTDAYNYSAFTTVMTGYSKCYFNAIRSTENPIHLDTGESCVTRGTIKFGIFE